MIPVTHCFENITNTQNIKLIPIIKRRMSRIILGSRLYIFGNERGIVIVQTINRISAVKVDNTSLKNSMDIIEAVIPILTMIQLRQR
ncbi:hypothetical protein QUF72_04735 [Desulfobacterales bacterium HSG2]|nr:hypothetical protein [Desulfobacterales bacterium HSG2]